MSKLTVSVLEALVATDPITFSVTPVIPNSPAGTSNQRAANTAFVTQAVTTATSNVVRRFGVAEPLPVTDIGPIWHDLYNSWMTWQIFNANGASYTGYASQFVGEIRMETQPTARPGYVLCGSQSLALPRTQYAALRAWGLHNGRFVASGVWVAGTLLMADNPDGVTFRAFDVRGEFPRFWDDDRGVDAGRVFGSAQAADFQSHGHQLYSDTSGVTANGQASSLNVSGVGVSGASRARSYITNVGDGVPVIAQTGGTETRPRNTAFSAQLKF